MLSHYLLSHLVAVVTAFASILATLQLLRTRRTPQSLLAWLLAIVFMPFLAIPLYLILGRRKIRPRPGDAHLPLRGSSALEGRASLTPVERVLGSTGMPPAREGNDFQLLPDGEAAYGALLDRDPEREAHHSHLLLHPGRRCVRVVAHRGSGRAGTGGSRGSDDPRCGGLSTGLAPRCPRAVESERGAQSVHAAAARADRSILQPAKSSKDGDSSMATPSSRAA